MTIDEFRRLISGKSGNLNGRKLEAEFKKNSAIKDFIETALPRDDFDLSSRAALLFYNGSDECRSCKTKLASLKRPFSKFDFLCRGCRVERSVGQRKATMVNLYGTEHALQNEDFKKKAISTTQTNYGVDNPFQSEVVKEKSRETMLTKYGAPHGMQVEAIRHKTDVTHSKKYGKHFTQTKERLIYLSGMSEENAEKWMEPRLIHEEYMRDHDKNLTSLGRSFGVGHQTLSRYFSRNDLPIYRSGKSFSEEEFVGGLVDILPNVEIVRNSRKVIAPYELDILFPDHGIAIEYCGAYWHSEAKKTDKNYHFNKWKMCRDAGIKLLTFWDLEVDRKRDQVLNFVKSNLGIYDRRIYARDTIFKETDEDLASFFDRNHMQGKARSNRRFVLEDRDNGDILGAVSFGAHHRTSDVMTLNRLAFKSGVQIVGGASKLMKNSLKQIPGDVVTWSDNRYSTGEIYERHGFRFEADLRPDYCYFDANGRILRSKQSCKKSAIGCPEHITERQFLWDAGVYRLWDCGKRRFVRDAK